MHLHFHIYKHKTKLKPRKFFLPLLSYCATFLICVPYNLHNYITNYFTHFSYSLCTLTFLNRYSNLQHKNTLVYKCVILSIHDFVWVQFWTTKFQQLRTQRTPNIGGENPLKPENSGNLTESLHLTQVD